MCAPIAIPLAAAALGAGANYYGQSQSNAAMQQAAEASMVQQRGSQMRQLQYQDQQDAAQQRSREVFNTQTMDAIDPNKVQQNEAEQRTRVGGILNRASTETAANANPTRAPDAVSTVGAPTTGGAASAGSKAYDAALAANIARAIGFNTQQAGAQAGITGRQFAAADQQRALERSGQGIYQNNDQIAGLSRLIAGEGGVMNAIAANGQANVNAAAGAGSGWKTAGTAVGALGSLLGLGLGAGLGSAAGAAGAAGKGLGLANQTAQWAGFIN